MTLGRLRREIEPVTRRQFHAFLARWQHTQPGTQLHGAEGVLEIIRQLQGYEVPAAPWESQILTQRIAGYEPELLDELCLSGEVMWARVSPHPALDDSEGRRIRATRVAPIALLLREDAGWLDRGAREYGGIRVAVGRGSGSRWRRWKEWRAVLRRPGAYDASASRAKSEDALWELVAAGLVTADGFDNLRALIDPERRRGGAAASGGPWHSAGRWALVPRESTADPERVREVGRATAGAMGRALPRSPGARGGRSGVARAAAGAAAHGGARADSRRPVRRMDSRESSLRGPKRSTCCALCGVRGIWGWRWSSVAEIR